MVRGLAARAALVAAVAVAAPLAGLDAQTPRGANMAAASNAGVGDSALTFERGLARIVQRQLGLTDAQLTRLQAVDRSFRPRRLAIQRDEVQTRRAVRRALAPGATAADAAPLDTLLDRLVGVQSQRAELLRAEQQELRQFLSPVQRARYLGIQEFVRRRAEELRGQRRGATDSVMPFRRRIRP